MGEGLLCTSSWWCSLAAGGTTSTASRHCILRHAPATAADPATPAPSLAAVQAQLVLEPDGAFVLRCLGRRALFVNGQQVPQGGAAQLPHLSLLKCGGVSLLFLVNEAAVRRVARRSAAAAV